jgi:hypothetical protein
VDATLAAKVIQAERRAVARLDVETSTQTTFECPVCGGTAHVALHEWMGHEAHCENDCF